MDYFKKEVTKLYSRNCSSLQNLTQEDYSKLGLRNITLHHHQLQGTKWIAECYKRGHGCILGDEMGLGKTLQSIVWLLYLKSEAKKMTKPYLVVCPLSVVSGWESEFKRATPHIKVLNYCSDKEKRAELQENLKPHLKGGAHSSFPFDVIIAHYEVVLKDATFLQKFHWSALIVDEGHRLKNPLSMLNKALRQFTIDFTLLLTGTPVQNNLNELYSLLSFVAPRIFPIDKMELFVKHYTPDLQDNSSKNALHSILEPFLLRRTKSEVLVDLPVKSELVLYTELSPIQRNIYKAILTKDLSAFGQAGNKTRLLNILSQLRKCINHPYLFDGIEPEPFEIGEHIVEASGKLFIIDKLLELLKTNGHRVLIFSQMTRMLDIVQDYLSYRGYSYERLDGSVRGEERYLAIQNFADSCDTFVFLLSTRAGGQGLNLVGADTVLFIDSDFNPQNDIQAAARAHRIGQSKPVKVIRLIARDTAEEIILRRAEAKRTLTERVIEGGQFTHGTINNVVDNATQLSDILKYGLDKILESNNSNLECEDLESIVGFTDDVGNWIVDSSVAEKESTEISEQGPDTIYMYEGKDYSRANDEDRKRFDELLAAQISSLDVGKDERVLRSEQKIITTSIAEIPSRKRTPLTKEQIEERKRKREETKAKKQKLIEEAERKRKEEKERKKQEWWKRNNYISLSIELEESSSSDSEEEEEYKRDIEYVIGDVTYPQSTGDNDAIIVHCVDDSGKWGRGGLFSAISARSMQPETSYQLASKMKDLKLGDVHLIPIDDMINRQQGNDLLALIISQSSQTRVMDLSALDRGLRKISHKAKQKNGAHPWIPKGVEPLPDIFTGVCVCFCGVDEGLTQELKRYIIAYNGDVTDSISANTTHVITCEETFEFTDIPVVTVKWIQDSLIQGTLLDHTLYSSIDF